VPTIQRGRKVWWGRVHVRLCHDCLGEGPCLGEVNALGDALARLSAAGEGDSPQANSWMEPLIPTF